LVYYDGKYNNFQNINISSTDSRPDKRADYSCGTDKNDVGEMRVIVLRIKQTNDDPGCDDNMIRRKLNLTDDEHRTHLLPSRL